MKINSRLSPIDLSEIKTIPLGTRENKVKLTDLGAPAKRGRTLSEFLSSLPAQLAAVDFHAIVKSVAEARRKDKPVIWAMGAHVIKCGLSPLVIDLLERNIITGIALNGAGSIHDIEMALIGETSEDVADGLETGLFGMAKETGAIFNETASLVLGSDKPDAGLGALLGRKLIEVDAPNVDVSILAAGARYGVPVTVHVAIGTDIVHMHPNASGEAIGKATFNDFKILCSSIAEMGDGGVFLNIGSAVILPEVFLKALTVVRNLGRPVVNFTTVNLDMQQHYRPLQNVVKRPAGTSSRGYSLTGHHEIMLPLLAHAILEEIGDD